MDILNTAKAGKAAYSFLEKLRKLWKPKSVILEEVYIIDGFNSMFQRKYEDALNSFNRGFGAYPRSNVMLFGRALALQKLGEVNACAEALKQIDGNYPAIQKIVDNLLKTIKKS